MSVVSSDMSSCIKEAPSFQQNFLVFATSAPMDLDFKTWISKLGFQNFESFCEQRQPHSENFEKPEGLPFWFDTGGSSLRVRAQKRENPTNKHL